MIEVYGLINDKNVKSLLGKKTSRHINIHIEITWKFNLFMASEEVHEKKKKVQQKFLKKKKLVPRKFDLCVNLVSMKMFGLHVNLVSENLVSTRIRSP